MWLKKVFSFDGIKMNQCTGNFGVHVGDRLVSDTDYAYDAALFNTEPATWNEILKSYESVANSFGMHCNWQKTKLQNIGSMDHHHYMLYLLKLLDRW